MNAFNWQNFYDRLGGGGFIEALKSRMKEEYDYVLIDSRTGVSDTSGVCTVQLPDVLVVCFTLNRQSIEGASAVAASVEALRQKLAGAAPLRIFPVPMRVEKAEKEKLDLAHDAAIDQFAPVLAHVEESKWKQYWGDVEVLYEPFYAYEEVLSTFRDTLGQPTSMLASMERITAWLTDTRVTHLVPADEADRQRVLAKYTSQSRKERGEKARSRASSDLQFYISYARVRPGRIAGTVFHRSLSRGAGTHRGGGGRQRLRRPGHPAGADWQQQLEQAIRGQPRSGSDLLVGLLCEREHRPRIPALPGPRRQRHAAVRHPAGLVGAADSVAATGGRTDSLHGGDVSPGIHEPWPAIADAVATV